MKTRNIFRYLLLMAMLCSTLFAQAVGNLKGALSVNQGSMNYSVDILTPPGVAGVEPKLSFEYNQNSGNGHLGVGWSIGGLSSITRCGSTVAQDGKNRGLKYDYSDNYCMDGQRLISVQGSKGKNGTEYHTEIESYSKIVSHGSSGNGPAYFKVYTKSGDIYEYGNSADSKAKLSNGTVRVWAVNKIVDKLENDDNAIKFYYSPEMAIDKVYYANSKNYIDFVYSVGRKDKFNGYVAGTKVALTRYLSTVKVNAHNNLIREYKLSYKTQHETIDKLKLKSIQEFSGGQSLKPLTFEWDVSNSLNMTEKTNSINSDKILTADFNGDGITDLYIRDADRDQYDVIKFGDINGEFGSSMNTNLNLSDRIIFKDFNQDGYMDIYQTNKKNHEIFLNNGSGKFITQVNINANGTNINNVKFTDFNGDGYIDILYLKSIKYWKGTTTYKPYLLISNKGVSFSNLLDIKVDNISTKSGENPGDHYLVADINGDNLIDIVSYSNNLWSSNYIKIWSNNSNNTFTEKLNISVDGNVKLNGITLVDFNADGLMDIYEDGHGHNDFIWLNTGINKFIRKNYDFNINMDKVSFIDFNSDGYPDIYKTDTKELWINQASWSDDQSTKFKKDDDFNADVESKNLRFGDFNGNGAIDFYDAKKDDNSVWLSGVKKQVINSITDSFGNKNSIKYKNLTDNSIYSKRGYSIFPNIELQPALKVVESVETSHDGDIKDRVSYYYTGLNINVHGRGSLGFQEIKTIYETKERYKITKYHQDFPRTGMLNEETTYLNDGTKVDRLHNLSKFELSPLSSKPVKINTIDSKATRGFFSDLFEKGNNVKKIFVNTPWKITQESFYPNVKIITFYNEYDKYGNVLEMETKTEGNSEEFIKTTTNVYDNIESEWLLGRLVDSTVTHVGGDIDTHLDRRSEFVYNQEGMLEEEIIHGDKTLRKTYEYDTYGNKTKETISGDDIETRSTSFTYDANHQFPVKATKPLGHTEEMRYYPKNGKLEWKKINNNNNLKTTYRYDAFGKPMSILNADGTEITYQYGLSSSAPNGYYFVGVKKSGSKPIVTYHDSFDRKVRMKKTGFNGKTIYEDTYYNNKGEVYKATAPYFSGEEKTWIKYKYDKFGRAYQTIEPSPEVGEKITTITYNDDDFETVTTNAKNQEKRVTKNALGKVIKVEEEMGATVEHKYDALGNLRASIEPSNAQIQMRYDSFGNKTYMNDPDMGEWSYTYNILGELTSQTDAKLQTTTITYDILGRMTKKVSADQNSKWVYDTVFKGALSSETDNKGFSKIYKYDNFGKVTSATTTIDGQKYTKSFTYDSHNRVDTVTEPNNFKLKHDYSNNGELQAIKTPRGTVEEISEERLKELMKKALQSINDYKEKALESQQEAQKLQDKANYYERVADAYQNRQDYGKRLKAYAKKLRGYASYYERLSAKYESNAKYYKQRSEYYYKKAKRARWWSRGFYKWYAYIYKLHTQRSIELALKYTKYANDYNNRANIYDMYGNYYDSSYTQRVIDIYTKRAKQAAIEAKASLSKAQSYLQMAESSSQASEAYQEIIADRGYTYFYKVLNKDSFGRVTSYLSGNGLINQKSYDISGVMNYVTTGFGGDEYLRNISYTYDALGNVQTRVDDILNINQDFEYDSLNRITSSQTGGNSLYITPMSYDYDANGNMRFKSDIGNYSYDDPTHIHAVTRAGNKTFQYDANGNMINNNGQKISYNSANKPVQIKTANNTIKFSYNQNNQRYKKTTKEQTTHYLGKTYERIKDSRGNIDHKHYIYADGKVQAIHTNGSDGEFTTRYLHYDALNSVDTITDMTGTAVQRTIYKPFGEKITVDEEGKKVSRKDSYTNRGYTGHESIQETENLIHMNGRIYDSAIGRFISADPHIQAPNDTQSYNRYSYVKNNPLKYTDPSGYFFSGLKKWFKKHWKAIVTTVATVAVGFMTGGMSLIVQGAAIGFTAGAVGTLVNGGSLGSALKNGIIGGIFGAVGAGLSFGIGEAFGHGSSFLNLGVGGVGQATMKAVSHGIVRGIMHAGQGGKFGAGFASGFISSGFSVGTKGFGGVWGRTAIMATVGGTVSEVTGGKFGNGAMSAAFVHLFNTEAKNLGWFGNSIRDISGKLNSDFEKRMFARYWNSGGDYQLSTEEFNDMLSHSKVTGINENSLSVSLYSNEKYDFAIGSATIYFSTENSNLIFYDHYDFDTQPWGSRGYFAEFATRSTNTAGSYNGASSFNIYYLSN